MSAADTVADNVNLAARDGFIGSPLLVMSDANFIPPPFAGRYKVSAIG
ncbi:hypothetical protein [Glutamicibacter sp. TV12E]